ncbi:MAG: PBSX family phage terminase large subunit, partial [Anaerotignaceae bacterium]
MPKLSEIIAPSFYSLHNVVKNHAYTHFWLKGGRGSTKSSFVSIEIILGMMKDPDANCIALRKVGMNLKDSIFEQLEWAIKVLGVSEYWQSKISPLTLTYIPTGQRISFRGADKPKKIKSTKFHNGYCKYIWYEEVDEFSGMEEIRTINQSLMRGGENFFVFYSYNPPQSQRNWVNTEVLERRDDRKVHHSTYLTVPHDWLGEQFFIEAEHLKNTKPEAYNHEYMGEVTGTGGEIFLNLNIREITGQEIETFDNIARGLDWGYASDPFHYTVNHYDKTRRRLYIFHEIQLTGL